ncbi:MAG: hypothetical protein WA973_13155 [Mesorhizobium sp.]
MPFKGIAEGEKLAVLFTALQSHCGEFSIRRNSAAYHKAGSLTLKLFREGATTPEALATALRDATLSASNTLEIGQRVVTKDTAEGGTVVEANKHQIKVKWDRGRTSYYRRGRDGNIRHAPD